MARRPARKGNSLAAWINNQLWNTSLLWLLGCIVVGVIFWNDTTRTQADHSAALARLEKAVAENKRDEAGERGKIRDQFVQTHQQLTIEVANLNKQTAITSTVLQGVQRELEKIAQKLDSQAPVRR